MGELLQFFWHKQKTNPQLYWRKTKKNKSAFCHNVQVIVKLNILATIKKIIVAKYFLR